MPPVLPPGYDYGPGSWFIWEWADIYYDHIAADYVIGGGFVDGGSPNSGSSISSDNIAQSNYSIIQPSLRIQGSEPAPVEEIVVIYKAPDRPRPFRVFSYLSDSEFWHNTAMIVITLLEQSSLEILPQEMVERCSAQLEDATTSRGSGDEGNRD